MVTQGLSATESLSEEGWLHMFKLGVEKDILDIPDLINFRQVSRQFYRVSTDDTVWIGVLKKIDGALLEPLNKEKSTNAFEFLKNEIASDVEKAKSSKEASTEDIGKINCLQYLTIEKIREIKSKNLIESNSNKSQYFNNQRDCFYDESGDTMHSLAIF